MKEKLIKSINLKYKRKYVIMLVLCIIMLFFLTLFNTTSYANVGDLDGNEEITITDLIKLRLHLSNIQTLDDEYKADADINGDGKITITDLVQLNLTTLGIKDYISLRASSSSIDESNENVEYTDNSNQERTLITSSVYNIMKASSDDTGVIQNGEYLIQFEANGGEIDTYFVKANLGDEISVPTPTRTYTLKFNTNGGNAINNVEANGNFLGWYAIINNQNVDVNWSKNSSGNIVMSELDGMNNGQIRVYAKWGEVNINIPSVTFEKTGYIFKGWYTNFNCTNRLDTEYFTVTESKAQTTTDVTIYAGWTPKEYNITYDLDGGTLDTANPETYNIETKSFTLNNPTKTGYEFNGWLEEGKTTPVATAKISMGTVGDKKYTATWEKKSYTVKFNTDGGSVNPSSINAVYEEKITLPEPSKNGYNFVNWKLNNNSYQAKEEYTVTDNVTFTAEWKAQEEGIYVSLYDSNNDGIGDSLNFSKLPLSNNNIIENYGNIENSSYNLINDVPWKQHTGKIITVNIMDKIYPTSTALWFAELTKLTQINNISNIDTSNVTNMKDMFEKCYALKSIDVSSFDTSNVTNMYGMFAYCTSLENLNLSTFNTSNVINMSDMFFNCDKLTDINLSNFDTKKVQNISAMFEMCTALKEIDLKNFDISNVTNYSAVFSTSGLEKIYGNGTWVKVNNNPSNSFNGAKTDYVIINVEVSFDANGGSVSSNKKTVEYGREYGELPVATKAGETFDGWYTQANGGTKVSVDNLMNNAENHTLYAHWSKSSLSVIIDPAGGYVDITDNTGVTKRITESTKYEQAYNTSLQYGKPQKESVTESKTEYTITYNGNEGIADKATDEITNTKVTVYEFLRWKQSTIFNGDLSNKMGSGTYKFTQTTDEPDLLTAEYKETVTKNEISEAILPGAKRDGYTFTGWYDNQGNIVGNQGTVYQPSEDITLYAHWKINTSTLRIDPNGGSVKIYDQLGGIKETITSAKEYTQDYNTTLIYEVQPKNGEMDNSLSYTIIYNTNGGNENIPSQIAKITKAKGYIFSGWTQSTPFNGNITPATNTYTFGKLNNAMDTITANYSENSGSSQDVETITLSTITPTKSGYQFLGWVSSTDGKIYQPGASYTPAENTTFTAKWDDKTITVTFDANGDNAVVSENSKEVTYNEKYGELTTAVRTGYTFDGWFTEAEGGDKITSEDLVQNSSNHTLYAHWTVSGITVTFDVNGDNATVSIASKEVVYDEEYGTLPDAQRDGYEFDGWYSNPTGGFKITPNFPVTENKNHTIYAQWIAKKLIVTYNGNGGTPRKISKDVTYGKAYGELDIADRAGYTFDGWYTEADGGTEVTENTIVQINENHTIYAHWATKKVYVTYEGNGGTPSEINKEVSYKAKYGELATADRTGYKFDGWFTEEDGGTEVTSDTFVTSEEDHTIYAHWTKKGITVTFDANGGTVSETSREVTYGKVYGTLPQPTKEGYQFSGWYISDGNEVRINTKVKTLDDHTIYARWNGVLSTIIIDPYGGKITIHSQDGTDTDLTSSKAYSQESNTVLTYDGPTKDGSTSVENYLISFDTNGGVETIQDVSAKVTKTIQSVFKEWLKSNQFSGTLSETNKTYTFGTVKDAESTIIAVYEENEQTTVDPITLPQAPTKAGYEFAGWRSSTDNQVYQAETSYTPTGNTIFTAQWSADVIKVTYDATGGQVTPTDEQINKTVGKEYGELPTPNNRTGYTFDGWYTSATEGDKVSSSTIVTQTIDHTLYAHWKADKSAILIDPNGGQVKIYSPSDSAGETITSVKNYVQEYDTSLKYDIPTRSDDVESENYVVMYDTDGGNETMPDQNVSVTKTTKYTFDKWDGANSLGGTLSEINKTYTFGIAKTVTDKITASYTSSVENGNAEITLPQAPTKAGYKFGGWKSLANGQMYLAEASYTVTEDTSFIAQWNTNKITVIYDGNGGTASEASKEVTYGGVYGRLATATREGYEFGGWYTQAEGGKEVKINTRVNTEENHTLYAHWNANLSTLIIDTNDGKITIQSQSGTENFTGYKAYNQEYNTTITYTGPTIDDTIENGIYVVTYNLDGGVGSIPDESITTTITTSHVFSGWTKTEPFNGTLSESNKTYTFGKEKETIDTILANYTDSTSTSVQSMVLSSTMPTKSGYKFAGWKSSTNNQVYQSGASYTPTEDTTFTAQWEVNTITVSYDARGGNVNPTTIHTTKVADEQYGELPVAYDKTGYAFVGWETQEGTRVNSDSIVPNNNHTLYAVWELKKYNVSFETNGGTAISNVEVNHGETVTKPTNPTKTGYEFKGWYTNSGLTTEYNFTTPVTSNITLYAKWDLNQFTVTFNTNGGSSIAPQTVNYGQTATRPTNPTKAGSTFVEWFIDTAFTTEYNFSAPVTNNMTLYAKWNTNRYTVSFNSNGGSSVTSQSVEYGQTATKPTNPTKTGNTFVNWYTDSNLTTVYNFGTTVTNNITLYAKWSVNQYTVTFNTNGGSSVASQTVNYGQTATRPTNPTKSSDTFVNWYSDPALVQEYDFDTPVTRNITLYAKWNLNVYTVRFNTDGGTRISDVTIEHGRTINRPTDPTKQNNIFRGWYTDEDYTTAYNFSNPVTSNLTLYANWELIVNISMSANPKVDVMITKSNSNLDTTHFEERLKQKLLENGIDPDDVNVTVATSEKVYSGENAQEMQTDFNWQQDIDTTIGSLTIANNGNIEMIGNPTLPGKNVLWYNAESGQTQEITFDYNIDFGDSFNAAGVLLRVAETDSSVPTLSGYMLSFNQNPSGYTLTTDAAYYTKCGNKNGAIWKITYDGNNTTVFSKTLVQALTINNSGSLTIKASEEEITISGGGLSSNVTVQIDSNWTTGSGFGFFAEHYTHNCNRLGSFTIQNVSLTTITSKTMSEVLRVPDWSDNSERILLNIEDFVNEDLQDTSTYNELLTRFMNEDVNYLAWGTYNNKAQFDRLISAINQQGTYINNVTYDIALQSTVEYIRELMNSNRVTLSEYVVVGTDVYLNISPDGISSNTTDSKWTSGKWRIDHNYTYFENNLGQYSQSGVLTDSLSIPFDKVGKLEIYYKGIKTNPGVIYVHRKPVAIIKMTGSGNNINLNNLSYDLDKLSNSDKGISQSEWKWKLVNDTSWNSGVPSNIEDDKDYIIRLRVKDYQDTWSDPATVYITSNPDSLPVASFYIVKSSIAKNETLNIIDSSYDPKGYNITSYKWEVYKGDELKYTSTSQSVSYSTSESGDYTIYLTVTNSSTQESERFGRKFTVNS